MGIVDEYWMQINYHYYVNNFHLQRHSNNDALLPRDFQGNMNYWPKFEDKVRGLRPVIYVTLKKLLGNSDIPLVVIIDFFWKKLKKLVKL